MFLISLDKRQKQRVKERHVSGNEVRRNLREVVPLLITVLSKQQSRQPQLLPIDARSGSAAELADRCIGDCDRRLLRRRRGF